MKDNPVNRIEDQFGRPLKSLRLSVTDRCNFACWYCYHENDSQLCLQNREDLLSFEQITRLVKIFTELGVDNVRLTGGEPLLRQELHILIKKLKSIRALEEVTLTTNGYFLVDKLPVLKEAGLDRINLSLDTFRPDRFKQLTGSVGLDYILLGLEKLLSSPELFPVKLNTVLVRGFNDDEIDNFINWARDNKQIVRFIEFMPLEGGKKWDRGSILTTDEVKTKVRQKYKLVPEQTPNNRPASRYKLKDGGQVGFISSISNSFCDNCDRIRLTADGKIKNCLFGYNETDIKTGLENKDKEEIKKAIIATYNSRWEGGCFQLEENNYSPEKQSRSMSRIGG